MRIYLDPLEMVKEVERDLFEMGIHYQSATVQDQHVANDPKFQTIELTGYAYKIKEVGRLCPEDFFNALRYQRGVDADYETWMTKESQERLDPSSNLNIPHNPGTAWTFREDFWGRFIRGGIFSYSYTERWQAQLPYIVRELINKPDTRQAIMTMYDRHEDLTNWGGYDRVPCSVSYQFIQRDKTLSVIYNQRSCDFQNFFIADVYFTYELLMEVAFRVGCGVGDFIHFLGSLHAFAGDLEGREIF
jgi:thymidylate synthase